MAYRLKKPWSDGSTAIVYEPLELIAKLLPLMPSPRSNQVRFHGVLAPAATWRDVFVPVSPSSSRVKTKNYCWAELMMRVFEFDVLCCPKCRRPHAFGCDHHRPRHDPNHSCRHGPTGGFTTVGPYSDRYRYQGGSLKA